MRGGLGSLVINQSTDVALHPEIRDELLGTSQCTQQSEVNPLLFLAGVCGATLAAKKFCLQSIFTKPAMSKTASGYGVRVCIVDLLEGKSEMSKGSAGFCPALLNVGSFSGCASISNLSELRDSDQQTLFDFNFSGFDSVTGFDS